MSQFHMTVGLDWSEDHLDACAVDPAGTVLFEQRFGQDADGVAALAVLILQHAAEPGTVGVAIELKRGGVIAALVERGFVVASINPKQLDRFRDRFSMAGAKDDRRDARALADGLRTDPRAFRFVESDHPLIVQIREGMRAHDDLTKAVRMDANRLRDQLVRHYMAAAKLGDDDITRGWFLDLITLLPTPEHARRARPSSVTKILKAHRIRKVNAEEVLAALRQPSLPLVPGTQEAAVRHVGLLVERLRLLTRQLDENALFVERLTVQLEAEESAEGQVCEQHDVTILRSLPGVGKVVLAMLLAEAWGCLKRRDYPALRRLSGVAPVTKKSGRTKLVSMRRACNQVLRQALHHMARAAVQYDPHWNAVYTAIRKRDKNCSASHAYRIVGDKLLRVMTAALTSQSLYDPSRLNPIT